MSHAYGKVKTPDKSALFLQDKNILSSHKNFRNLHKAIVYRDAVIHPFYFHHLWSFMACCIILLYNVCSVHRGGGGGGRGGGSVYYIGGCSVHWEDTMSTSGDIMSKLGGVQYIGGCSVHWGYHEYIGGYHEYIEGLSSTSAGYHDTCGKQGDKAFQFILKTLMYWTSPDVLMISSDILMVSPWCTEHPPPMYWTHIIQT